MGARVVVVDDDPSIVRVVAANLHACGYDVLTAASGEAALNAVETHQPDCIVLDLGLPGSDGLEVLRRLRTLDHDAGGSPLARIRIALRQGQPQSPKRQAIAYR
jgi:CheY-like chemotaxis protein